jgi:hypothetical protein
VRLTRWEGIFHPKAATAFTITWVLGRIPYTLNYATGKPETRVCQSVSHYQRRANVSAKGYGLAKVSYIGILGPCYLVVENRMTDVEAAQDCSWARLAFRSSAATSSSSEKVECAYFDDMTHVCRSSKRTQAEATYTS